MKTYYLAEFRYAERSYFCIWYNDEVDGFYTENDKLIHFDSLDEAKKYSDEQAITYSDEVSLDDMVKVQEWVSAGIGGDVDCHLLLVFWNSVHDLAATIKREYIGNERVYTHVYEKLFYGNNLPTINTSGREYIPEWTDEEVLDLKQVIGAGILMFAQCFGIVETN